MADTEYITKESALACFSDWIDRYGHEHTADEMIEYQRIEELPAADVVEVVRCKECRFFHNGFDERCCINHKGVVVTDENGYCHHGVRRKIDE